MGVRCVCMHVCMHKHATLGGGVGGMPPPMKFLEIRCSEIAFEVILEQKQSHSSYMACGVLHPIFGCPCMHLLVRWLWISRREGTIVGWTACGVTSLGRQLVNSRAPEIAIYLCMYLRVSFHRSSVNSLPTHACSTLVLHEQTCIAATRLLWMVVILNSSESSVPISNSRALEMYS